jgi:ribosomal protein L16 Arg81 hydroxylase
MSALTTSAVGPIAPAPVPDLSDLVGNTEEFFSGVWRRTPHVFRNRPHVTGLISEAEMWEHVDCGLLIRPYFVAFNEGVRSALSEITTTRTVVGHDVPGYVNADQVRADFAAGGTFKLNQPEHWLPRFSALVESLAPAFRAELETYVFLSPPDRTAITTHMDGSHVFVLQVAGRKDWVVGLLDDDSVSVSDRYRGEPLTPQTSLQVTLEPGDVLYMPHGAPHHATAREGNSIHVAVTVEEPTPDDVADVLLASAMQRRAYQELESTYHRSRPADTVRAMRGLLREHLATSDPDQVMDQAVAMRLAHYR